MNKPKVLYFIRSESDLERITSIAIPGKNYASQYFAYYGDIDILFDMGIKNNIKITEANVIMIELFFINFIR